MPTQPANADADLTSAETPVEGHAGEQYLHGADNSGHGHCDCGVS